MSLSCCAPTPKKQAHLTPNRKLQVTMEQVCGLVVKTRINRRLSSIIRGPGLSSQLYLWLQLPTDADPGKYHWCSTSLASCHLGGRCGLSFHSWLAQFLMSQVLGYWTSRCKPCLPVPFSLCSSTSDNFLKTYLFFKKSIPIDFVSLFKTILNVIQKLFFIYLFGTVRERKGDGEAGRWSTHWFSP